LPAAETVALRAATVEKSRLKFTVLKRDRQRQTGLSSKSRASERTRVQAWGGTMDEDEAAVGSHLFASLQMVSEQFTSRSWFEMIPNTDRKRTNFPLGRGRESVWATLALKEHGAHTLER
jgi:hypothetical protein